MLFYVSFWLVARMEHKLDGVRPGPIVSCLARPTFSLIMVGFTAVYREGFETALFYQALRSFMPGCAGVRRALRRASLPSPRSPWRCSASVAERRSRSSRRSPLRVSCSRRWRSSATVQALQATTAHHRLDSLPRLPTFLSQVTGYWPTLQSIVARVARMIYIIGGAMHS
jgi:high-affinity iron transporter